MNCHFMSCPDSEDHVPVFLQYAFVVPYHPPNCMEYHHIFTFPLLFSPKWICVLYIYMSYFNFIYILSIYYMIYTSYPCSLAGPRDGDIPLF